MSRKRKIEPERAIVVGVEWDSGPRTTPPDLDELASLAETAGAQVVETNIGPLAHSDFNRKASPCFLCSRLRRRRLFELAREYKCTKVALAHNKDDMIETLLLNIFFAREISTMLPYQSFFKGDFHLMRPLAYIEESLLKRFAREEGLPVIENPCPTARNTKRQYIKDLIRKLDGDHRGIKENIFKAMKHVKPDYLLKE